MKLDLPDNHILLRANNTGALSPTAISFILGALAGVVFSPLIALVLPHFMPSSSVNTPLIWILAFTAVAVLFALAMLTALFSQPAAKARPKVGYLTHGAALWFAGYSVVGIAWSAYGLLFGLLPLAVYLSSGVMFVLVLVSTFKWFNRRQPQGSGESLSL